MTIAGVPAPQCSKEARALVPIWLATTAAIAAGRVVDAHALALVAFALGAAALGAYSTGHEYACRTLAPLLAQPVERSYLLRAKLLVLAPLVILLAAVSWVLVLGGDTTVRLRHTDADWRLGIVTLMPLLAVGVAPWLAILCRSTMAGLVFTLAVPSALWTAAEIARTVTLGFNTSTLDYGPTQTLMTTGIAAAALVATVAGRRRFLRHEAMEAVWAAPSGLRSTAAALVRPRSHPLVLLARKELRLHTLAVAVAGLYTAGWIAMRLARMDLQIAGQSFEMIAAMYGVFLAVIAGATASAEERALGVTSSQALQPYAFWKQWTVKVAVTVSVALVLGPALAWGLESVFPLIADSGRGSLTRMRLPGFWGTAYGVSTIVVTMLALHLSTLCTSGLRALIWMLAYVPALGWLYTNAWISTNRLVYAPSEWWRAGRLQMPDLVWASSIERWTGYLAIAGLVVLVFRLGLTNHRSAEHGRVFARQVLGIALYVTIAAVIVRAVPGLALGYVVTR